MLIDLKDRPKLHAESLKQQLIEDARKTWKAPSRPTEYWFKASMPWDLDPAETDIEVFYEVDRFLDGKLEAHIHSVEPYNAGDTVDDLAINKLLDEDGGYWDWLCSMSEEDYRRRGEAAADEAEDRRLRERLEERGVAVDVFSD